MDSPNQKIGKMSLHNLGAFSAKIQFTYLENGQTQLSRASDYFDNPTTKTVDPGDLGVPAGSTLHMKGIVVWDKKQDKIDPTPFQYDPNNPAIAHYKFSGDLISGSKLELLGVSIAPWENWSKNIVFNIPDGAYFYPASQADLKQVLAQAKTAGATVRASGQRHSQPPLVTADNRSTSDTPAGAWLVDLACYADLGPNGDQRMVLDASGQFVTVNTGVREDELDAFLTANNKMLQTVTAGGFFSVGGMTAVDVHGATVNAPIFAETASAFTIMEADGSLNTIDGNSPEVDGWQPLQFARVSLGALGIVTSVTIGILDRPYATTLKPGREEFQLLDKTAFIDKFTALCAAHTRLETFFDPYAGKYLSLWWDLDNNPPQKGNQASSPPNACDLADENEFGAPYEGPYEYLAEKTGIYAQQSGDTVILIPTLMYAAFRNVEQLFDEAGKVYSDLWLTQAVRVMFMSYFIELPTLDETGLGQAWEGLNAVTERLNQSKDFLLAAPMEFRFVQGGNTALANTYTQTPGSTFISMEMIGFVEATEAENYPPVLLQFFADIERKWTALGGMPHNGKMYGFFDPSAAPGSFSAPFNPNFLQDLANRRKDRVSAFDAYRLQCDPDGRFSNDFVRALLGPPGNGNPLVKKFIRENRIRRSFDKRN